MEIGNNLKQFRTNKNMTQKELAEALNVSYQAVSRWENDEVEPDIATLSKLSEIFGVTVDELISGKKEEKPLEPEVIEAKQKPVEVKENKKPTPKVKFSFFHGDWGVKSFIGGAISALIALVLCIILLPKINLSTGGIIALCVFIPYGVFATVYCLFTESYILDVFTEVAATSIKFPGVIFTLDLGGIAFLIVVKVIFAIIGFLAGCVLAVFSVGLAMVLSMVSFPVILPLNIKYGCER